MNSVLCVCLLLLRRLNIIHAVIYVRCRSLHLILFILADNPYAVKEVDKAEDFDVNRLAENYSEEFWYLVGGMV